MRVTPITEAQAADAGLRKRGLYDFEVSTATEEVSNAGNDMIKLFVKLYDTAGNSFSLFDYLVSSDGMAYKVRHFASATGLLPAYEKGELRAIDCIGRTGRCQVGIERGKNNYPDKNNIQDYVPAGKGGAVATAQVIEAGKEVDDEIPF